MRKFFGSLCLSFIFLVSCATHRPVVQQDLNQTLPISWVEIGPQSQAIVRTLTQEKECPAFHVDYQNQKMTLRSSPSAEFPVSVCEGFLPSNAKRARVGDQTLALPTSIPKKIVVLGDTGCRVKFSKGKQVSQACNDADAWPFEKIAQAANRWKPDLVIHVGDYLYREAACPADFPGCIGSPVGDTWNSWSADFFTPGRSLITHAPWVFIRGNHEGCGRGGEGWFRFLEPRPFRGKCSNQTDPYAVQAGPLSLAILDTAGAEDAKAAEEDAQHYANQLKQIQKFRPPAQWILTHKPFWLGFQKPGAPPVTFSKTLLAADQKNPVSESLQLLIAGHVHLFAASIMEPGPVQLIAGNGGTQLYDPPEGSLDGFSIEKRMVKKNITLKKFGFLTFEAKDQEDSWKMTLRDVQGNALKTCHLDGKTFNCE